MKERKYVCENKKKDVLLIEIILLELNADRIGSRNPFTFVSYEEGKVDSNWTRSLEDKNWIQFESVIPICCFTQRDSGIVDAVGLRSRCFLKVVLTGYWMGENVSDVVPILDIGFCCVIFIDVAHKRETQPCCCCYVQNPTYAICPLLPCYLTFFYFLFYRLPLSLRVSLFGC